METPQQFEWDANKNASNLAKHKLGFELAAQIFEGIVLETLDTRQNYGEDRYIALGEVKVTALGVVHGIILYVAYTWRGNKRRLISARKATPKEQEAYHAHQK